MDVYLFIIVYKAMHLSFKNNWGKGNRGEVIVYSPVYVIFITWIISLVFHL